MSRTMVEELVQPRTLPVVIEPARGWVALNLRELWHYRGLVYFLTWRDVKVRYKQTLIGVTWAVLQPFLTMVVFSVVFGRLARVSSEGVPYPVFSYSGLLPWTFFATGLTQASTSLVSNANLVSKVYFPRLVIPIAAVLAGAVDFVIAFSVLLGMLAFYGIVPGVAIVTLPLFLLLAFLTALGGGLWLSALDVRYRDIRYAMPFFVQFWLFATPVAYPSSLLPERWRLLYGLNPMAGVIEGFRWALFGQEPASASLVWVSAAAVLVLFAGGLFYFRRTERDIADMV